jgi:hypothetical protein
MSLPNETIESNSYEDKALKQSQTSSLQANTSFSPSAHLVTGVNAITIAAQPQIENILEEDEEEDVEKNEPTLAETNNKSRQEPAEIVIPKSLPQSPKQSEPHKFILETVIVENDDEIKLKGKPASELATAETSSTKKTPVSNTDLYSGNAEQTDDDINDVIRVEEGYATRQMDEYFRQTIAAIKEELTKKLESKNTNGKSSAPAESGRRRKNEQHAATKSQKRSKKRRRRRVGKERALLNGDESFKMDEKGGNENELDYSDDDDDDDDDDDEYANENDNSSNEEDEQCYYDEYEEDIEDATYSGEEEDSSSPANGKDGVEIGISVNGGIGDYKINMSMEHEHANGPANVTAGVGVEAYNDETKEKHSASEHAALQQHQHSSQIGTATIANENAPAHAITTGAGAATQNDYLSSPVHDTHSQAHHHHHHHPHEHSHGHHRHHHHHHVRRMNRSQLYNYLLMSTHVKPSRADVIASWLVVIGCFLNQFIIDGLCFNYVNLLYALEKNYTAAASSKMLSLMPGAFLIGFYLLVAPLAVFLTKRFGTRRIAVIGSLISTLSLLVSSFLTDIVTFTLFYGIFTGVGISLIYVPSLIETTKWFLKKRLFINTLTLMGGSLGAAIYPIISEYLFRRYALYGALLVLSAVQFNCLVGSLLLRERRSLLAAFRQPKTKPNAAASKQITNTEHRTQRLYQYQHQHQNDDLESDETGLDEGAYNKHKSKSQSTAPLLQPASPVETLLKENDKMTSPLSPPPAPTAVKKRMQIGISNSRPKNGIDAETESNASTSTATVPNYTLKQYWRKFVQTRKTQANAKKNLFHLIAEEKRKTRTMSKTSLEDGFYITTSNNLLAPDESNVVISSRQAKFNKETGAPTSPEGNSAHNQHNLHHHGSTASSSAASRFFSRIANSLRSLTHAHHHYHHSYHHPSSYREDSLTGGGGSGVHSTTVNQPIGGLSHSRNHLTTPTTALQNDNLVIANQANEAANSEQPPQQQPQAVNSVASDSHSPDSHVPPQLASVFMMDVSSGQQQRQVPNETNKETLGDEHSPEVESDNDEQPLSPTTNSTSHPAYANSSGNPKANLFKAHRYLSYRNSLTNSVRGSLIECSVPEDREGEIELGSGGDGQSVIDDDDMFAGGGASTSVSIRRQQQQQQQQQRQRRLMSLQQQQRLIAGNKYSNSYLSAAGNPPMNSVVSNPNEIRLSMKPGSGRYYGHSASFSTRNTQAVSGLGYLLPSLLNARRFISIVDGCSFYNCPLNLETIEHNLKNSFIKPKNMLIQKQNYNYNKNSNNRHTSKHQHACVGGTKKECQNNPKCEHYCHNNNKSVLLIEYLEYLTNLKLYLNPLLMILNFSFSLNIIGNCIIKIFWDFFDFQNLIDSSILIHFLTFLLNFQVSA